MADHNGTSSRNSDALEINPASRREPYTPLCFSRLSAAAATNPVGFGFLIFWLGCTDFNGGTGGASPLADEAAVVFGGFGDVITGGVLMFSGPWKLFMLARSLNWFSADASCILSARIAACAERNESRNTEWMI